MSAQRRCFLSGLRQWMNRARTARLFAATEPGRPRATPSEATPGAQPMPDLTSLGLAPPPATPTAQDRQNAFLNTAPDRRTLAPDRVVAPASPNVLQAGAVISAALITGIRSDLPDQITAQVRAFRMSERMASGIARRRTSPTPASR
jgi:type IV secretory pathway VirB10-like protein